MKRSLQSLCYSRRIQLLRKQIVINNLIDKNVILVVSLDENR